MMKLEVIDWKKEYESDMEEGIGFIIDDTDSIIKDGNRRNPRGIYSPEYGTLSGGEDYNYTQRYSCDCGELTGRFYSGMTCKKCGTEVTYNTLNIHKCGWMVLDDYCLIQPLMYQYLSKLIGPTNLINIIKGERTIDKEGIIKCVDVTEALLKKNPFYNIGMLEFRDRIQEICDYFVSKNQDKRVYYDFIMDNKDKIFINHIPVFSLVLRDLTIINNNIIHEPINKIFNNLLGNICMLNRKTKSDRSLLKVLPNLYETQLILNELHLNIIKLVGGKEGHIRGQLLGFRINFSSRQVIVPLNGNYKINEVVLPYLGMMMLYKFEIINLIQKFDNITLSAAYNKWNKACETFDHRIYLIIKHLIDKTEGGLRVIINRNPSINLGSVLTMRIADVKTDIEDVTMSVPLNVLGLLAGDFDGDVLNIISLKGEFADAYDGLYNPRNMMIDRNNGKFNRAMSLIKDQLIGLYSFNKGGYIKEEEYTDQEIFEL